MNEWFIKHNSTGLVHVEHPEWTDTRGGFITKLDAIVRCTSLNVAAGFDAYRVV